MPGDDFIFQSGHKPKTGRNIIYSWGRATLFNCEYRKGGPGLGGIQPAQSDYFQAVKGGGHGDYHMVVLAPASIQEMVDLVMDGFDIADRYRNPVMVLGMECWDR